MICFRVAAPVNVAVLLEAASSGASLSPESRFPPRRLDGATHICSCASPSTDATLRPSDESRHQEKRPSQHDTTAPSTSSTHQEFPLQQQQQQQQQNQQQDQQARASHQDASESGRCVDCGKLRKLVISYTIEDLDTIGATPLESKLPPRACSCEAISSLYMGDGAGPSNAEEQHHRPDLRKFRSVEPRWANASFLAPEDALEGDLPLKQSMDGNEYRWELHTSKTDVDLTRRVKCSCHNLTPEEKKPHERGDLRKHHSAETDKWSIPPDHLLATPHDLRKHLSDDSRMARGEVAGWTLQVPEVMPNPKPRCTCPKPTIISPSPLDDKKARFQDPENRILYAKSLTTEESRPSAAAAAAAAASEIRPELKKHASEDPRQGAKESGRTKERGKLVQQKAVVISTGTSKKWDVKERPTALLSPEDEARTKAQRSRWAGMPHFSLPAERRDHKWRKGQDSFGEGAKSKSLKERPKYSVRRSISPEPDPRGMLRLNNRVVKRLISPEITITDAKWAPYEGHSPLPTIGIKKREPKHLSDIKWTPYDNSPSDESFGNLPPPEDPNRSPFQHPTPCFPPPLASPTHVVDEDEKERWRFLNVISPFPLYQGAWKDESPEKTPPKRYSSPEDLSPPVWSPQEPATPVKRQKPPSPKKATVKGHGASRKRGMRGRSESKHHPGSDKLQLPTTTLVRASSEEPKSRMRPQLLRSKALLEVPKSGAISAAKRSQSEEVPRYRSSEGWRGPSRAKSEEASRFGDPWSSIDSESPEVRQYVTTVWICIELVEIFTSRPIDKSLIFLTVCVIRTRACVCIWAFLPFVKLTTLPATSRNILLFG